MPYNLYADQLLGTKLVPSFVYDVAGEYVQNPTCQLFESETQLPLIYMDSCLHPWYNVR